MSRIPLLDPVTLSRLPHVAIKALRVVEGALTGMHQSPHLGQSIEFSEHKEYSPGDEVKHIDWKLYGKSDRYYIKQFEDETNLRAYLLVDASASMGYPEPGQADRENKFTYASILALSIAHLLFRQHDSVGLLTFNEKLQKVMPPKSQPSYLLPLANMLAEQKPTGETKIVDVLRNMGELAKRRSVFMLFSDLFADPDETSLILKQLTHQGHDVILFHIMDPDELEFPFNDPTLFEDMEVEGRNVQIDAHSIRPYYKQELEAFLTRVKQRTREAGIEYWQINTGEAMSLVLRRFLLQRNHQRGRR